MFNPYLKDEPKKYITIKQLIEEGAHEEALQLIDEFKEKGDYSIRDIILYNLLECEILFQQGLFNDLFNLAEETYKKSLGRGDTFLSIDTLLHMVEALIFLWVEKKAEKLITQAEDLLKTYTQKPSIEYKLRKAHIFLVKATFFAWIKTDADKAMEYLEYSIELYKECDAKKNVGISLLIKIHVLFFLKGEFNNALKLAKQTLAIFEERHNKYWSTIVLLVMGSIYGLKGDFDRSLKLCEQSLAKFKELNNKFYIATVFNFMGGNFLKKGELDKALVYLEQSSTIFNELGTLTYVLNNYDYIIQILIEKGDIERAQQYLDQMEQINYQLKDPTADITFLFNKALLLKTSRRATKRGESEEILKQILNKGGVNYELTVAVLLNLCELLLIELQMLNDLEILEDLESYINQLLDLAETSHSYILLAEIYYLKGKLALLTLNIKNAHRFLTQAQQIAERWNFNQLATKIYIEHNNLNNQIGMWEGLKDVNVSMEERIKLAGVDKQLYHLLRNRSELIIHVEEEKVSIHEERKVCLVCKGEISGFMFSCKCNAIYCENCARALTDLENVCWICNTPIDASKPSKPYGEEKVKEKDVTIKNSKK
ncbi:MAG: tetratricopeptide repeat protein [Promethearchaeota archaeon]